VSRLFVGASGWSYPSWKPGFYPGAAQPADFLRIYSERLPAVELNSTGYRLPSEEQFGRWAAQVPPGFRCAVKLPFQALRRLDAFQDLSPSDAVSKVDSGNLQILDVRFEYEYRDHRYPGR